MELLNQTLNTISQNENKGQRKSALEALSKKLASAATTFSKEDLDKILPVAVKAFEDESEACRSAAIGIVRKLLPLLGDEGMIWIFPAIAARMSVLGGGGGGATNNNFTEPSEDIRLELFQLSSDTVHKYQHEVGPRGFAKSIGEIIGCALRDQFPDLLKLACAGCLQLCDALSKHMPKEVAIDLAKRVKGNALQHKHMSVRESAVRALAGLIRRGAVEILADAKDEVDNRTTVFFIYCLAHDRAESVRRETLRLLDMCLTDIADRLEQHRRLVPIVLAMLTDPVEEHRTGAMLIMHTLGKIYTKVDHEDNRIDLERRRVTVKDIEWYADDPENYSDKMATFVGTSQFQLPPLIERPPLGDRLVVAECARHFLDKLLADLTGVEWLIPFSTMSRRMAALRVLHVMAWYLEDNVVQHMQPLLGALFKTLLHDERTVRTESMFCVEMLGKFVRPETYIEILLRKPKAGEQQHNLITTSQDGALNDPSSGSATAVVRKGTITVTTSVQDASAQPNSAPLPTLYQTAAATTKRGILVALRCLLLGVGKFFITACGAKRRGGGGEGSDSSHHNGGDTSGDKAIAQRNAKDLVTALSSSDILDVDQPALVLAHAEAIEAVIAILVWCKFCPSPTNPLPHDMYASPDKSTLDSILLGTLLGSLACPNADVVKAVRAVIQRCSLLVSETPNGWFNMHCHRILHKKAAMLSPEAFAELMERTDDVSALGEVLTNMFVARLQNINYQLRVVGELKLLTEMKKVLSHGVAASALSTTNVGAATAAAAAAAAGSAGGKDSSTSLPSHVKPVHFTPEQLDLLVRSIILPQLNFVPGPTAHLFRKIALQCLRELLRPARRRMLRAALAAPAEKPSADPREPPPDPLSERLAGAWHSMIDNDDSECRVTAAEMVYDVCMLPLSAGMASSVFDAIVGRLDDSSDPIRLVALQQFYSVLMSNDEDVSKAFVAAVHQKMPEMVKILLTHMDDFRETIGIKGMCRDVLVRAKGMNAALVDSMARAKMALATYSNKSMLQSILDFAPNQ